MNFLRITDPNIELKEGNYSIPLGKSVDFFDSKNSFDLEGYLFLPAAPKALIVFQGDIFMSGTHEFSIKLGESLKEREIAFLTYDNAGTSGFGGKSGGLLRDYLPEQINRDLHQAIFSVSSLDLFQKIPIFVAGFTYGCIPVSTSLYTFSGILEGAVLLSPPENGKHYYQNYLEGKIKDKIKVDEEEITLYDIDGKVFELSSLFFSEKRMLMNVIPLVESVYSFVRDFDKKVRLIYAGNDEILGNPQISSKDPFFLINGASHDFANKWDEMILEIIDFVAGLK
ncbi:hypothetical protein JW796_02115 [Candidatus Dojkabacteria bacterium]|nr:hypothetical protein [Candidatus Dojkabacteria bacterium]